MRRGWTKKWLYCACLLPAFGVIFAAAGLIGVSHLESQRSFCNACHLPGGKPLHELKMQIALRPPGIDSTAVHFQRIRGRVFSCVDCHNGPTFGEHTAMLWRSFANTMIYAFGEFQEPERLVRPIQNGVCEKCHAVNGMPRTATRFHGIDAHAYPFPALCIDCHLGHAQSPDGSAHAQKLLGTVTEVCGDCHDVAPPPITILTVLDDFSRQWRSHLP